MLKRTFLLILTLALLPTAAFARIPNDPHGTQWGYTTTRVYDAWEQATGSEDIVVAIIDNGFDDRHPDIAPNLWINEDEIPNNGKDDDKNGYIDDVRGWSFVPEDVNRDGVVDEIEQRGNNTPRTDPRDVTSFGIESGVMHHATLVAGIIGARGNNNESMAGINWKVKLMNLQLLSSSGTGGIGKLPEAIRYAVDNGADVINLSIIGKEAVNPIEDALEYAYQHDVVVVAAAGNKRRYLNADPRYPVCGDAGSDVQKVLGVSAITQQRTGTDFSNAGSNCIDLTAPGVNVGSTLYYHKLAGFTQKYSAGWKGTSFAAPFVSGAAALIKSVQPTWGADEIYDAILSTVHRTEPENPEIYADLFGNGLLQVDKAVQYAMERSAIAQKRILNQLQFIDPTNGVSRVTSLSSGAFKKRVLQEVTHVDSMHQTVYKGDTYAVTAAYNQENGNTTIRTYDESWTQRESWSIPTAGSVSVLLGDFSKEKGLDVALFPSSQEDAVLYVFTEDGELVSKRERDEFEHELRTISVSYNADTGKDNILTLKQDVEFGLILQNLDAMGEVIHEFRLNMNETPLAVEAGDLNGDGIQEFIVVTHDGMSTRMRVYTWNAKLKRNLKFDSPAERAELQVGDIDGDGQEDMVMYIPGSSMPLSVWTDYVRRRTALPIDISQIHRRARLFAR